MSEDKNERPKALAEPGIYQTTGYLLIPVYIALLVGILGVGVALVLR